MLQIPGQSKAGAVFFTLMITVTVLFFSSCKKDEMTGEPPVQRSEQQVKDSIMRSKMPRTEFTGIYNSISSQSTLLDCENPDSSYIVIDVTGKLETEFKKNFPSASIYNSVVTNVKGELRINEDTRTNEQHPQVLVVRDVISVNKKTFDNNCMPYDVWAFGSNKNWTLQISRSENLIELHLPEGEKDSYYFFYSEPKTNNEISVYSNYNTIQKTTIEISIRKERCINSLTGKEYEYKVDVILNETTKLTGCGIAGKEFKGS